MHIYIYTYILRYIHTLTHAQNSSFSSKFQELALSRLCSQSLSLVVDIEPCKKLALPN